MANRPKCGTCKWLDKEETIIGRKCMNPERPFRKSIDKYSAYKKKHTPCCKRWEKE